MDINGATPTFNKVGTLSQDRNYSNMTVLADGKVMINGGSSSGNSTGYSDADVELLAKVMEDPTLLQTLASSKKPEDGNSTPAA